MSTYFVDPYKKYYDKLVSGADLVNKSETLRSDVTSLVQITTTLESQLNTVKWNEAGYKELVNSAIPELTTLVKTLEYNITNCLAEAGIRSINNLLPVLEELKAEDEIYENLVKSINSLVPPEQYDFFGNESREYKDYINKKSSLENDKNASASKCSQYKSNANVIINGIKSLDTLVKEVKVETVQKKSAIGSNISLIPGKNDGNLISLKYNNGEYYVVNTKGSVVEYSKHLLKNGMYQNNFALNGECMIASQIYARDLLTGKFSSYNSFVNKNGSPATRINNQYVSDNKEDVLAFVYSEVLKGHPVVLQVTQKMTKVNGSRHLVTVVGFNKNVKNASELTEKDVLVLDNVDGKIQTLADRNRLLFKQGGKKYYALGPTEEFLTTEVTNS